jgi:phosphatidylglycerophosphate synthase
MARRGVSPNAISLAGMICGVAAGIALSATTYAPFGERVFWLGGALLILLRLLANMFDGMVAIELGQASPIGELYNEVPDRVSDTAILIGAGYAFGGNVALGYLAACVAIFTAYIRAMGKGTGAPQEFCGPMAKQQRMAVVISVAVYCALMPASWQPTWGLMAAGLAVIVVGGLLTAIRRLVRIARNLRQGA